MNLFESNSLSLIFFFTCLSIFLQNPSQALITSPVLFCPASSANYTSGGQYGSNLVNLLFPSLISNGPRNGGFFNTSSGNNTDDTVYGLVQCRGDISMDDCRNCLKTSSFGIVERCPNKVVAGLRYEHCLLRYSNVNFFTQVDSTQVVYIFTTDNVSDPSRNALLGDLMNDLTSNASSKPTKFETGFTRYTNFGNIYGMVQCTQDLSRTSCFSCLQYMISQIPNCCSQRSQGMVVCQSCIIKFADVIFFELQSPPPPPSLTTPSPPVPASLPHSNPGMEHDDRTKAWRTRN